MTVIPIVIGALGTVPFYIYISRYRSSSLFLFFYQLMSLCLSSSPPPCIWCELCFAVSWQITQDLGAPADCERISDSGSCLGSTDSGWFLWPAECNRFSHSSRKTRNAWLFPVSSFPFPAWVASHFFEVTRSFHSNQCWPNGYPGTGIGRLENKRTSGDHQDSNIIKIGLNTVKSPGELMWKTFKSL